MTRILLKNADVLDLEAGEVQAPLDILRSATTINAKILGEEGNLGVVAAGADADLIAFRGNPLDDLGPLAKPEESLDLILARGAVVVDRC